MIVLVICIYAAIAAVAGALLVRLIFGFTGKMGFWHARSRIWLVLLQIAFGVAYMVVINLDAGASGWGWDFAVLCGVVGGLLSLIVALPLFKTRNTR